MTPRAETGQTREDVGMSEQQRIVIFGLFMFGGGANWVAMLNAGSLGWASFHLTLTAVALTFAGVHLNRLSCG